MFSTCFYTSFLSRDFLYFCTNSLYTCSYSHLLLHTRRIFSEIVYQITQVPRVFDTRFLSFYTTCAIRCTCRKPNKFLASLLGNFFFLMKLSYLYIFFIIFIALLLGYYVRSIILSKQKEKEKRDLSNHI